jgi:hypothetical protein
VEVDVLEQWTFDWVTEHQDDDEESQERIEEVDDDIIEGEHNMQRKLVYCCDMDRPKAPPPLVVLPTTQNFVTVHDYITKVHDWLQSLQADISKAMGKSSSPSTRLYVDLLALASIHFEEDIRADPIWNRIRDHARRRQEVTMIQ